MGQAAVRRVLTLAAAWEVSGESYMQGESSMDVTRLLRAWGGGDQAALEQLTPAIYAELRSRAHGYMKNERPGHTLQTTALANEAWLRLVNVAATDWKDRAHFFAIAANVMRRILVDSARARGREKRGGSAHRVDLDEIPDISRRRDPELIAVDDALDKLAELDPRKAKVIELRFFGGLSVAETAEVLKVHEQTVLRDWRLARIWMMREIGGERPASGTHMTG
jgi:RNA polymerase sigma-70 factor (ECF subfamily)